MTVACPPSLRFALHALLALAVLLQSSIAVAMHAASRGATPAAVEANHHRDSVASAPSLLPPCHVLAAAVVVDAPDAAPADCCSDEALGETCRWACAQAINLPTTPWLGATRALESASIPAPLLPSLRWTAPSLLRPPIG